LTSAVFAGDEPVLQSHPLIPGAAVPVFGDFLSWSLEATRRPASLFPSKWAATFAGLDPVWNLRAREVAMTMLNPGHPAVLAAGLHLGPQPAGITTVGQVIQRLSVLAAWAARAGLPSDLRAWQADDARAFIEQRRTQITAGSLSTYVAAVRLLHQLGPLLTGGGLTADPWSGRASQKISGYDPREVTTPNIAPGTWFPLVRAAWTYLHVFAPDILAARSRHQRLLHDVAPAVHDAEDRLEVYLAGPANVIPLHTAASAAHAAGGAAGDINWSLLSLLLGVRPQQHPFRVGPPGSRACRMRVKAEQAVSAGRGAAGGLLAGYASVARPDGTIGSWHPGLCVRSLAAECVALRGAAYSFVAALSMMRDSEIREITRGPVTEHYGAPAITAIKRKHDPGQPREHWWVIEPVAEAIAVAEALSWHPERIFVAEKTGMRTGGGFASGPAVRNFISHVNVGTGHHGLHISPARVAPHMFRKTMSMLTGTQPGAEIALGIQLKHVAVRALANRATQGYSACDTAWEKLLDTGAADARFARLSEFYDAHHAGKTIGFGPAAQKLTAVFDAIRKTAQDTATASEARQGGSRAEYDLLRKARIPIRFGKLNHCTLDESNPAGARCLEGTTVPPEHRGPLIDRCQPGRCANSIIGPSHLPIWESGHRSLLTLLDNRKLPLPRRAALERQLHDVQDVIDRARARSEP
jgi:hypothetical protein